MIAFLNIAFTFFKIGAVTFGGGYAMIPLIMSELTGQGLMTRAEVTDIIAISQVTPGTFAINAATFSGVSTLGILGGVVATIGVMLPSIIIASLIARYYTKFQDSFVLKTTMRFVRPVVLGLIASAAIILIPTALLSAPIIEMHIMTILRSIDIWAVIIAIGSTLSILKFKQSPILIVLISGILGLIIYAIL